MSDKFRTILFALGSAFAILAIPAVQAADNPFAAPQATQLATGEMKCASGKCATGKCKGAPVARDAAVPMADEAEMKALCAEKIRSGFCGSGKCASGKCGESLKDSCARMMEGKKCGTR